MSAPTRVVFATACSLPLALGGCVVVVGNGDHIQLQEVQNTGRIGVELADVSAATASQAGVDASRSCIIRSVSVGSAAERAGLQQYDIVTHIDGRDYATVSALREAVRARRPGETLTLTIIRESKARDVTITCGGG